MIKLFSNKISHLNKKVKYLQTQFSYLHIMTNFGHKYILILNFYIYNAYITNSPYIAHHVLISIVRIIDLVPLLNELSTTWVMFINFIKNNFTTTHMNKKVKPLQTQFSFLYMMRNISHKYFSFFTFIFTILLYIITNSPNIAHHVLISIFVIIDLVPARG